MKKFIFLFALLLVLSVSRTELVFGWGAAGSDGSNYKALQETAVFFNNSGATLTQGMVVKLDIGGAGVATDTTLGSYVDITQSGGAGGQADNRLAVGVVLSTSVADQMPIVVVTKGPALTTIDDADDAVSAAGGVGTSGDTHGRAGGGSELGIALEAGDGTDGDQIIVWVNPSGAD